MFLSLCLAFLPGGSALAEESVGAPMKVTITPQGCEAYKAARAPAGADYTPGVDVNGRPVAPADLPDERAGGPPPRIPITIEVPAVKGAGWQTEIKLFTLYLDLETGKITGPDGEPFPMPGPVDIEAACRRH
ncbi:MAG: hypothetical protein HXY22_09995 [Alphaproteobacteria bacterium]|nr:hypothetical protein [Alphaproteobacteria bacterium]